MMSDLSQKIRSLESASKRTEKEQILITAFMEGPREMFTALKFALDPLRDLGLEKVALIEDGDDGISNFTFAEFFALTTRLRDGKISVQDAKPLINDAALRCDAYLWNTFFRRVLLQRFDLVDAALVNKVLDRLSAYPEASSYRIPVFDPPVIKPGSMSDLKGQVYCEWKIPGERRLVYLDGGDVRIFDAKGRRKEIDPEIKKSLLAISRDLPSLVFDCILTNAPLSALEDGGDEPHLALTDIIPLHDFERGKCTLALEKRHAVLVEMETTGLLMRTKGRIFVLPKVVFNLTAGKAPLVAFLDETRGRGFPAILAKKARDGYSRSIKWLEVT